MSNTLSVFSSNSYDAIYNGNRQSKYVSLMINVYWGTEYIDKMLEILDRCNVKCTFFVGGCWAIKNIDVLKKIGECGHEIGNHGYFHKDHKYIGEQQNQDEIYMTHQIVKNNTGIDMNLFAPPSGSFSNTTLIVANNLGYKTIMWSKDTIDWRDKDGSLIYNRATKNIKGGDLILMHPTEKTAEQLENIVKYYQNNNFEVVTVSKNIA